MEPPVKTTPEGVEMEPHKIGHRWADMVIAGSAMIISIVSVAVAMHHGKVQEELVAANSWPFLRYEHGNSRAGESIISMSIENVGVGPALLKTLRVTYDGTPVLGRMDFLNRCCGYEEMTPEQRRSAKILSNSMHSAVVPAGESRTFLSIRQQDNPQMWERLDSERWKLKFEACYCSVLHACWHSDLSGLEPERVKQCQADPALDFQE